MNFRPHKGLIILGLLMLGLTAPPIHAADKDDTTFTLQSSAFANNEAMPSSSTCEGQDISPPLAWSHVPAGTQSFVLIVDDPDAPDPEAPRQPWVHWVIFNIPVSVSSLAEGANPLPAGTGEGINDWQQPGYRGPCPPVGRHRYFFKLYALDAAFPLLQSPTKAQMEDAMRFHILMQATLIGTYGYKKR